MFRIITPAVSKELTTLENVRWEMNDQLLDATQVNRYIRQASAAIVNYCDRPFGRETVFDSFRPTGVLRDQLFLTRRDVQSITSVSEDGLVLDPADYEVNSPAGIVYRLSDGARAVWGGWSIRSNSIVEITYVAGWLLPRDDNSDLPADVERACLSLVISMIASRGRDPLLRSESEDGVGSSSWLDPRPGTEAMPPQVAALLEPYCIRRAAS
jgi:hypothetical protein